MPLDPEVREFLDALASADQYPATGNPSDVRTRVAGAPVPALEGIWRIEELTIPAAVPVRARLYTPDDSAAAIVIALHGGGWVLGDLLFMEAQCRQLANRVGCRVLSIDYRLAPEHPFPAALDDVYASLTHVTEAAGDLGVDRSRIAIYGQSAGANLAAAAALKTRDLRGPELCLQVLVYPVVDADFTRPSYVEWGDGPGLTRAQMQWYWDCYAPKAARTDSYVSPLHAATLAGLPPALVVTAGGDPLQSEGQAYAERLEADGVNVVHSLYDGMHHGFMNLTQVFPKAQLAFDEVVRELRRAFANVRCDRRFVMPETPTVPGFLTRCANDEFVPPPLLESERHAALVAAEEIAAASNRLRLPPRAYTESRRGTAAGLLAVNDAAGESFFAVPPDAALDAAAADEALGGEQLIIDVQTHYIADRGACETNREIIRTIYPMYGPDWWEGCSEVQQLDLVEYLRCVFLESDTAVAVLSSAPGLSESRMLFDEEMAATRLLLERLGANGRLLNHAVVHPGVDGEIESMLEVRDRIGPVGWKVYTIGATDADDVGAIDGWYLDDDIGEEFLEQVSTSGVPIVCAHKGVSGLVPTGSPRDFGPAASRHPDISFIAYHSGFEPGTGEPTEETREGPFTEATADVGVNRLVKTLIDHGVAPGSNVYAELGTTWYCLVKRPLEAAHVLGKLLNSVGEDNVLWGTDAIWYGPTQTAVDTFRAFQIPAWMRVEFGYPELTPALKEKVLGLNAARVYGIDVESARSHMGSDDVQWAREAMAEYRASGTPTF